jgi:hypothetical protein
MYSSRSRRVKQLNSICLLLPESALRWSYMAVELSTTPIQMCSSARRMQSSLAAESSGCRHNPSVTSALPGLLPGKHSMVFPLAIRALSKCEGNFRFAICARSKDSLAILKPPVILREVRRKPNAVEGPPLSVDSTIGISRRSPRSLRPRFDWILRPMLRKPSNQSPLELIRRHADRTAMLGPRDNP